MAFLDGSDPPVGMYDYSALDHPIQGEDQIADALAELRQLAEREAHLRSLIAALTRDIRPAVQAAPGPVACLNACRAARRQMVRTS